MLNAYSAIAILWMTENKKYLALCIVDKSYEKENVSQKYIFTYPGWTDN